jgi:hypothetical protein
VAGYSEHSNEYSGSVKGGEFLDQLTVLSGGFFSTQLVISYLKENTTRLHYKANSENSTKIINTKCTVNESNRTWSIQC